MTTEEQRHQAVLAARATAVNLMHYFREYGEGGDELRRALADLKQHTRPSDGPFDLRAEQVAHLRRVWSVDQMTPDALADRRAFVTAYHEQHKDGMSDELRAIRMEALAQPEGATP